MTLKSIFHISPVNLFKLGDGRNRFQVLGHWIVGSSVGLVSPLWLGKKHIPQQWLSAHYFDERSSY